jgi:hypothetical protein
MQAMQKTPTAQPIEAPFGALTFAASMIPQTSRQDETAQRQAGTDASRPTCDALSMKFQRSSRGRFHWG